MSSLPRTTPEQLRASFETASHLTVGVEDEVMVLDADTFDLVPHARRVLERLGDDSRFKGEMPAAQLEIVTEPASTTCDVVAALAAARRDLVAGAGPEWAFAAAGVHPFASAEGVLSDDRAYAATRERYGAVARRQLVFALQVHVAVSGAERALAVYNALRSYLPEIAALAANARWYEACDSGLASIRPKIAETLPRQGVPPPLESWEEYAAALDWGAAAGFFDRRTWWWELRPHAALGTLEVRVPDAQATVSDSAAVIGFVHALVAWLAARHDAGEPLPVAPRWRIEENRWSATRDGVEGVLADLDSGAVVPTRERLSALFEEIGAAAAGVGAAGLLEPARALLSRNGAVRQREAGAGGARAVAEHLAAGFTLGADG